MPVPRFPPLCFFYVSKSNLFQRGCFCEDEVAANEDVVEGIGRAPLLAANL